MSTQDAQSDEDLTLWDIKTVAERTGLSERYVRRLFQNRQLPIVKIGRLTRVRPADLKAYIAASTTPAARDDSEWRTFKP